MDNPNSRLIQDVANGRVDRVDEYLRNGASMVGTMDTAIKYGHIDVVFTLLAKGADVHEAIDMAIRHGEIKLLEDLLESSYGKNVNPIPIAVAWGDEEILNHLKKMGY